jgi:hypothetical protein
MVVLQKHRHVLKQIRDPWVSLLEECQATSSQKNAEPLEGAEAGDRDHWLPQLEE